MPDKGMTVLVCAHDRIGLMGVEEAVRASHVAGMARLQIIT